MQIDFLRAKGQGPTPAAISRFEFKRLQSQDVAIKRDACNHIRHRQDQVI
jgi:hypothetical protein